MLSVDYPSILHEAKEYPHRLQRKKSQAYLVIAHTDYLEYLV